MSSVRNEVQHTWFAWPSLSGMQSIAAVNKNALSALIEFNSKLCSRIAGVNSEWATFVQKRLVENFEASRCFAECRSVDEVYNAYTGFLEMAFEKYQTEFLHMLKLGLAFTWQNANVLKEQMEQDVRREIQPTSTGARRGSGAARKARERFLN